MLRLRSEQLVGFGKWIEKSEGSGSEMRIEGARLTNLQSAFRNPQFPS
jgi:hypothetical protein